MSSAIARRCGAARRTGPTTPGRGRRTSSSSWSRAASRSGSRRTSRNCGRSGRSWHRGGFRRIRSWSVMPLCAPGARGSEAEVAADGRVDIAGVVDATQIDEVLAQWRLNGNDTWKAPALKFLLDRAGFSGKRSTPYAPGAVHDYMHAKGMVCDDTVFVGSFNLSHSGEENAENVLEIEDRALAEQLATFVDAIRARYPALRLD